MAINTTDREHVTLTLDMERLVRERVAELAETRIEELVTERVAAAMKRDPAKNKIAIIASKGTLDMAYPPLILATAAAAMGEAVEVFFTFYGLNIIKKGGACETSGMPSYSASGETKRCRCKASRSAATSRMSATRGPSSRGRITVSGH